jgi:hypothetical protein
MRENTVPIALIGPAYGWSIQVVVYDKSYNVVLKIHPSS